MAVPRACEGPALLTTRKWALRASTHLSSLALVDETAAKIAAASATRRMRSIGRLLECGKSTTHLVNSQEKNGRGAANKKRPGLHRGADFDFEILLVCRRRGGHCSGGLIRRKHADEAAVL